MITAPNIGLLENYNQYLVIKAGKSLINSIDRAILAAINCGIDHTLHFTDAGKTSQMPNGGEKQLKDYKLTRLACYLTSMNGDPRKPEIAQAQAYFAASTIVAELINSNSGKHCQETKLFSDSNYELAKKIGETARQLAIENNQHKARIADLEARLAKLEAPALPPSDGIRIKELLRCCGVTIDSTDGTLFSRLALDLRKAVEIGHLPQTAIVGRGRYRYLTEVKSWVCTWLNIR